MALPNAHHSADWLEPGRGTPHPDDRELLQDERAVGRRQSFPVGHERCQGCREPGARYAAPRDLLERARRSVPLCHESVSRTHVGRLRDDPSRPVDSQLRQRALCLRGRPREAIALDVGARGRDRLGARGRGVNECGYGRQPRLDSRLGVLDLDGRGGGARAVANKEIAANVKVAR